MILQTVLANDLQSAQISSGMMILSIIIITFLAFQGYFLWAKMNYYNLQGNARIFIFVLVIAISTFPIYLIATGEATSDVGNLVPILAIGMMALVSIMIPIMANYRPTSFFEMPHSKTKSIVDIIGLVASVLGIISFIIEYL